VRAVAAACLLGGPAVLAFFSGGYYSEPRLVAALVAWACVLALAVAGPAPLPRSAPGWAVLAGLALMTAWSAVSLVWAPLQGPAIQSVQRLALYVGALLVALGALRDPRAARAVEPTLAAGAAVVIGYGLAGRLLPGIVRLDDSRTAGGRLEQPLTYWNAEGALAAVGLILCARLAGDGTRPVVVRALAAAAMAPLGAGVYISFSRGALAVAVLGLAVLVALAPSREQLRAAVAGLLTATAAAAVAGVFPGVASLDGSAGDRGRDGAIVLAVFLALMAAAGVLTARRARAARPGAAPEDPRLARRLRPIAVAAVVLVAAGLVAGGLAERPSKAELMPSAGPQRLASVRSNRYEYWRVALLTFGRDPVTGIGAGGFRVAWLRERKISEAVKDAHSLEGEMAAELGLVGLVAFAVMVAGGVAAARRVLAVAPAAAAGAAAATLAWLLHASIDWDWQMPAVSLPAVALTGLLIVLGEAEPAR